MQFLCDDMLGKLAKRLRMLGFDTLHFQGGTDQALMERANKEERTVLTRDTFLAEDHRIKAFLVRSTEIKEQLKEVTQGLKLKPGDLFSRCSICNTPIEQIEKERARNKVPELVFGTFDQFFYCKKCDKFYWHGSHVDKLKQLYNSSAPW